MPLRVKFLAKARGVDTSAFWTRFIPGRTPRLGDLEFVFDRDARTYDWLVVYDDLPLPDDGRFSRWTERLACRRENTLLITTEPASIKAYGKGFIRQFGHVLTSQEPFAIPHPGAIFSQCALIWFYEKSHDECSAAFPSPKTATISTVCSTKRQKHTLHSLRYAFTRRLAHDLPELQVFGHGHRFIQDKSVALDPFLYHLAIENHRARHHWTEKLADAFLGGCLPFYFGAPNVFDDFPEESIIPIDLFDYEASRETIARAMRDRAYEKRLPALHEARRRLLDELSLFPLLARLLPSLHHAPASAPSPAEILSRRAWRKSHPLGTLAYGLERVIVKRRAQASTRRA